MRRRKLKVRGSETEDEWKGFSVLGLCEVDKVKSQACFEETHWGLGNREGTVFGEETVCVCVFMCDYMYIPVWV